MTNLKDVSLFLDRNSDQLMAAGPHGKKKEREIVVWLERYLAGKEHKRRGIREGPGERIRNPVR